MQGKNEQEKLKESARYEEQHLSERERELFRIQQMLSLQEKEFDEKRKRLKEEQLAREREIQRELDARELFFSEREKKLIERQRDFEEHLMRRQAEAEALRTYLQNEVADREAKLQQALIDLQQKKELYSEESRRKIEKTSKDYVEDTLETLNKKGESFHFISKIWSAVGAASLAGGILFFSYITTLSVINLPAQITWEFIIFSVFKGLIAIALLAGLARYSFLFSSSYMQEALKNADRRHAINFGKFYLESYGAAADWSQVKEAFEHWNISSTNAFSRTEKLLPDMSALEKALGLIERTNKVLFKNKGRSIETDQ